MKWQRPDAMTANAMLACGLMIAQMTEAKAIRDSVFLTHFPVSALPTMTLLAAVFAMIASYAGSRIIRATTPDRFAPLAFAISGILQMGERSMLFSQPRVAACVIYLHVFAINLMLTSSFWSLMNEHYDPRSAKQAFGKIAGMGTFGGIIGGLVAERVAAMGSITALILVTAALHMGCGLALYSFTRKYPIVHAREGDAREKLSARAVFRKSPYLVELAALMISVSVAAALLDYVFKAQVVGTIAKGPALTRFFAVYYTTTGFLGVLIQTFATSSLLSSMGLSATVAALPLIVLAGGGWALAFRGLLELTVLRAAEVVCRGSLFRSAYELFYTPVASAEKRAVKALIDVNGERMGDALGSGIIGVLVFSLNSTNAILAGAMAFSVGGLVLARRLGNSYAKALTESLRKRTTQLDDSPSLGALLDSVIIPPTEMPSRDFPPQTQPAVPDPVLTELAGLRSGDHGRVMQALAQTQASHPMIVRQLVQLLAVDGYAFLAMDKLRRVASSHVGQLADVLLSSEEEFVVRKRIPFILGQSGSQRALDSLVSALSEGDFMIRFRSAHALQQLHAAHPELILSADRIWKIIAVELQVSREVWNSRRLTENRSLSGADESERPGDSSLEYVFVLLSLVLLREPLSNAYRALRGEDKHLRGTALEYLETVLPANTWKTLESRIAG